MTHNVLITSAGKRVELLREFQQELKKVCPEGKVFAVDSNAAMSPACRLSDGSFSVRNVTDPGYIEDLLHICESNDVRLVIPTIDTELAVLAEHRGRFTARGIEVMVSDPGFISLCRDKRKTMGLFDKLDIKIPAPIDKNQPRFPMFAKPYDGSSSINNHVIRSEDDLTPAIMSDPKLMFMELIDKSDYKEYTVDLYYGADGKLKRIVPRERIDIRNGEVRKCETHRNYLMGYIMERMENMPGVRGCVCIQLFYRECDNDVVGIEINPRYGGGYPLSYYAGANFPKLMVDEYIMGKHIDYADSWEDKVLMLRYDTQVIVRN